MKEAEFKNKLTKEEYHILREKGTEPAFSGEYYHNKESGMYLCKACGVKLFSSENKYDSGSGWPSFDRSIDIKNVDLKNDDSYGMERIEVTCNNCGSHLGHVFPDGPKETTGQRFCINSLSLDFEADEDKNC